MENKNSLILFAAIIAAIYFYFRSKQSTTITPNNPIVTMQNSLIPRTPSSQLDLNPIPIIQQLLGTTKNYYPFAPKITPEQAVAHAITLIKNPDPRDYKNPVFLASMAQQCLDNGFHTEITRLQNAGVCKGQANGAANDLQLIGQVGQLSLTSLNAIGTSASLIARTGSQVASGVASGIAKGIAKNIPIIGSIIGGIVGIFSAIVQHHAIAVGVEQNTSCALLPAATNYLSIIKQSVQSQQTTPEQAIQALDSLVNDFYNTALAGGKAGGLDNSGGKFCNALCDYWAGLVAIVTYQKSGYEAMITG